MGSFNDGHCVNLQSERNFNYTHCAVYRIEGAINASLLGNAFKHCNQMVISSDRFNRLVSVDGFLCWIETEVLAMIYVNVMFQRVEESPVVNGNLYRIQR
jgi:hypothetical protein